MLTLKEIPRKLCLPFYTYKVSKINPDGLIELKKQKAKSIFLDLQTLLTPPLKMVYAGLATEEDGLIAPGTKMKMTSRLH